MSELEGMIQAVRAVLPGVQAEVDAPARPDRGSWFADLRSGSNHVEVEWRPSRGFGVVVAGLSFGEGPHETFEHVADATCRVLSLLRRGGRTASRRVVLGHLRELQGRSQAEVAERMGVQQSAVSKLERRSDLTISSLRRYVAALGGEAELLAIFGPDQYVVLL